MNSICFYKYRIINKQNGETKYFIKFAEVRDYCGISRPMIYKIFKGTATPKKWVNNYSFESVRIPTHLTNECA
tara:strand:+ start:2389 stop:2607 length:219 start_codon:yes stop_codon:yes gene_type:complete